MKKSAFSVVFLSTLLALLPTILWAQSTDSIRTYRSLLPGGSTASTLTLTFVSNGTVTVSCAYSTPQTSDYPTIRVTSGLSISDSGEIEVPSGTWWWVPFDTTYVPVQMSIMTTYTVDCSCPDGGACYEVLVDSRWFDCRSTSCACCDISIKSSGQAWQRGAGVLVKASSLYYNGSQIQ